MSDETDEKNFGKRKGLLGRLRYNRSMRKEEFDREEVERAKKPLRERKGFQVFHKIFPEVSKLVGNFVPGAGLVGKLYEGMSEKIISIPNELDRREVENFFSEALEDEALLSYVLNNTNSARNREVFLSSIGVHDWMKHILGLSSVLAFYFVIGTLFFVNLDISDTVKDLFFILIGRLSGHVDAIFNYYFGSSLGSYISGTYNRLVTGKGNAKNTEE